MFGKGQPVMALKTREENCKRKYKDDKYNIVFFGNKMTRVYMVEGKIC
jgi:hypothetical protein